MTQPGATTFRPYTMGDKTACLKIFDANCPIYFAPNEREEYAEFLDSGPAGYEVCVVSDRVAGAFGLLGKEKGCRSLNWILIDPNSHGEGIGSAIMQRIMSSGRRLGLSFLHIAASHKSEKFFSRFGAKAVSVTADGWGPGMNRVDMELYL